MGKDKLHHRFPVVPVRGDHVRPAKINEDMLMAENPSKFARFDRTQHRDNAPGFDLCV